MRRWMCLYIYIYICSYGFGNSLYWTVSAIFHLNCAGLRRCQQIIMSKAGKLLFILLVFSPVINTSELSILMEHLPKLKSSVAIWNNWTRKMAHLLAFLLFIWIDGEDIIFAWFFVKRLICKYFESNPTLSSIRDTCFACCHFTC